MEEQKPNLEQKPKLEQKPELEKQTEQTPDLTERLEPAEDFQSLIHGRYQREYAEHVAGLLAAQADQIRRYQDYRKLRSEAEALRERYPDFDLDKELQNETFAALLENRVDLETAYEVVHRQALAREREVRARSEAHPAENGLGSASLATVTRPDPRALTRQERRSLRRRAARGEEIVW